MERKKQAVIFDIDGTLAHMNGRKARHGKNAPYMDSDAWDDDLDEPVYKMLDVLKEHYSIIVCSGRKDSSREVTKRWLNENNIFYDELFMRDRKDSRKDSIVKYEIYLNNIEPYYEVIAVFDDRDQVVNMWRDELGLKCFQVQPGDF